MSQNIPSQGTITSTLNVTDISSILDLNVKVNISHNSDDQLDIYLRGPDGTLVELSTDNGGSGDNYTNTIFDDDGQIPSIRDGVAPFSGSFKPEGLLTAFDGKRLIGIWRLEITDDTRGTNGRLLSWSLIVTVPGTGTGGPGQIPDLPEEEPLDTTLVAALLHDQPDPTWPLRPSLVDVPLQEPMRRSAPLPAPAEPPVNVEPAPAFRPAHVRELQDRIWAAFADGFVQEVGYKDPHDMTYTQDGRF